MGTGGIRLDGGDTVTGRDEIAEADEAYRRAIGGDEWPE